MGTNQHRIGDGRRPRRERRLTLLAVAGIALLSMVSHVGAVATFGDSAFQTQWQVNEQNVANFWGPTLAGTSVMHEAYEESPGGARLVQYFDKGRMELTRPATPIVTNGLLTVEMLRGQIQTGDNSFISTDPADVPIAGDATNTGPTFAMLQDRQSRLLVAGTARIGDATTRAVTRSGASMNFENGGDYPKANIVAYDRSTGHNLPSAFATFREKVGVPTIGLAISEPFWSTIKVGGKDKDVLIQLFERRILTYTPSNPAAFQVELGNIGRQYFAWRYDGGATPTYVTSTTTATKTPATTQATSAPVNRGPCATPAHANFNGMSGSISRNVAITVTATVVDASGDVCGDGTQVVIADMGVVTAFVGGSRAMNGSSYVVVTTRDGVAKATFTDSGPADATSPVHIGVYAIAKSTDLPNGIFGTLLVDPVYMPLIR